MFYDNLLEICCYIKEKKYTTDRFSQKICSILIEYINKQFTMSLLDFMQDMLPESWFDNIRVNYGDTLTDEMISQSVQTSCEFFNMPLPELVAEYETTGVFPLDNSTVMDDILVFSREQLVNMGITQQDGLDLVMTHEQGHRALQCLNLDFDSHKEELCCDFMAGVRAGLNGMDFCQMETSLADTIASDTHPGGAERIEAIEAGVKFAKEYYEVNNVAPAFSDCLDYFKDNAGDEGNITPEQINLRLEETNLPTGIKGFINDKEYHLREAERHTKNGEYKMAADHLRSAKNCTK